MLIWTCYAGLPLSDCPFTAGGSARRSAGLGVGNNENCGVRMGLDRLGAVVCGRA